MAKKKPTIEIVDEHPTFVRRLLPNERAGLTHKFKIGPGEDEVKGYITTGCYEDGRLGEVFVKMDKQGTQVSGFVDAWSISVSMLLQAGMPVTDIMDKFKNMSFEPAGLTGNPEIPFAKSPIDYVARWLEKKYKQ